METKQNLKKQKENLGFVTYLSWEIDATERQREIDDGDTVDFGGSRTEIESMTGEGNLRWRQWILVATEIESLREKPKRPNWNFGMSTDRRRRRRCIVPFLLMDGEDYN